MTVAEAISKIRVWGLAGIVSYFRRRINDRKHARILRNLAVESKCERTTRGVTVIADMTGQVSLSKTMRDFVFSLRDAGVPCQVYDTTCRCQIPAEDAADIVTPKDEFDLKRYDHIVMMYRAPLDLALVPGIKIGRIAFHESLHGINETAPFLKESGDAILAMSDFNYDYYKVAFVGQPVFKITYPFRRDHGQGTSRRELRERYGIGEDDFLIYFNFDFGSYYRKNIPAALKAFARAFPDEPKAKLLFKTKGARQNARQCREMEQLVAELKLTDRFIHISDYLPRADVDGFAAASDVYLSLHKSEGFGLGMAEAMSQGTPVVATAWSANTEFCTSETAVCVPYRLVPIQPHEYMVAMKEWAEADVDAAAAALRRLYDDPALRQELGSKAKAFIDEHFSIANFKRSVEAWLAS